VAVIAAESLTKHYGTRRAIEDLTLSVPEGSLFGFLGPNGAGKTTTIRALLGFLRPTSGRAQIFGLDCWRASARIKADVGYLPGDVRLYPWMNGKSALAIFGQARRRDLRAPGRALAEQFGLDLSLRVRRMSKGTRQKLGLVLALAHSPRLLVLDEPTSGLDPLMQEVLRAHLKKLSTAGHTVFFSSHTLAEVEALCDRVAIVRDGRLLLDQPLDELRRRAGHEVIIRWKSAADGVQPPPPFLALERRDGPTWHARTDGPVGPLIEWLAGKEIADLSIGRPDLESLFKRFYQGEGAGP
jgi:ABC-2 type transport system ATP-binding protein